MSCPPPELLQSFERQELVDEAVRAHVLACARCGQDLQKLASRAGSDEATGTVGGPPAAPEALPTGTRIGRYVVLGELGSGGMGVVYAAHDPDLGRKVAIKLLQVSASDALHPTQARSLLVSEAQAMAKLAHPNVVSVFDVGMVDTRVFVAMEYVDGQTLRQWLAEKPRTQGEIRVAMLEAARGLAAAHQAGLVHRDFKPDNVMVGKDGRVRVMDFGIAHPISEGDAAENAGRIKGTPPYLAPEQLEGAKANQLTDQFSFGVTLYEALYGVRPFPGHPLKRDPATRWILPSPQGAEVSPALRRIALRALAVSPAERFPNLAALIEALAVDPLARRRRRMLGAAAVLAVAALIGGFQWRLARSRQLCRGFEAAPARLFDEAKRKAMKDAFAATGLRYAQDSYARAEALLDRYAARWAEARTEACEATQLRGEQPAEVLSLRMICLDHRLEEWSALTDLLSRADAELVRQAVVAAHALTPLDGCADIAALKAPLPPPADPKVRAQLEELRSPLAQLKTLLDAGKYRDANQRAGPLLERALATGYPPLRAEALYYAGMAQARNSTANARSDAAATLRRAFAEALSARDDGLALQACSRLVRELWEQGSFPKAEEWGEVGLALSGRLERASRQRSELLVQLAGMHWRKGELAQAGQLLDRAWQVGDLAGEGEARRASILNARGLLLAEMGEPAAALEAYAKASEIDTRLYGASHPVTLVVRLNWSIALGDAGRAREAIDMGERNLAALEATLGAADPNTLGQRSTLSVPWLLLGDAKKANALAARALEGFIEHLGPQHPRTGIGYAQLADTELELGRTQQAIRLYRLSLDLLDGKDAKNAGQTVSTLNGLGRALLTERRATEALPLFERALEMVKGQNGQGLDRHRAELGVASALSQLKRDPARARELAKQAAPGLEKLGRARLAREAKALAQETP